MKSSEVKEINFGDKSLIGVELKNDFIDVEDDDEYLKMSCSKRLRKRKYCDLQTLESQTIDSPIIQELLKKIKKVFINSGVSGDCLCGRSNIDSFFKPRVLSDNTGDNRNLEQQMLPGNKVS